MNADSDISSNALIYLYKFTNSISTFDLSSTRSLEMPSDNLSYSFLENKIKIILLKSNTLYIKCNLYKPDNLFVGHMQTVKPQM